MLAPMTPTVDMQSVQATEVLKTYWLLYPEIQKDFVHKQDLITILEASKLDGSASPPDFTLKGRVTWIMPSNTEFSGIAKKSAYKAAYKAGDAVKEGITDGIKEFLA